MSCSISAYLVVANSIGNSEIFYWNIQAQKFMSVWTGPPSAVMYPILVPQTTGALTLVTVGGIGATDNATLYQFSKIKDSDFSPRYIQCIYMYTFGINFSFVYQFNNLLDFEHT